MRYPIYSVRDLKGDFYSPQIQQNEPSAKRWFAQLVNTEQTMINFAPNDFELYMIGVFDATKGVIEPLDIPEFVVRASELVGANDA